MLVNRENLALRVLIVITYLRTSSLITYAKFLNLNTLLCVIRLN